MDATANQLSQPKISITLIFAKFKLKCNLAVAKIFSDRNTLDAFLILDKHQGIETEPHQLLCW